MRADLVGQYIGVMRIIYGLVDADTLELRYVGQTVQPRCRELTHLRQYPDLRMLVLERDLQALNEAEVRWIAAMRAEGARLLNRTAGGNVPPSALGLKRSTETRARMSAAMAGNQNGLGHTVSPETRAKLSVAKMGDKNPMRRPEVAAKASATHIRRSHAP